MVVSALINAARDPAPADRYRSSIGDREVVVSFMTVTELRYGAARAGWGEFRRRSLERNLSSFAVVQPNDELIHACADLRARCEELGHPLGQKVHEADRWIEATAIRLGVPLVSADAVFGDVADLDVIGPAI